MCVCVCELRVSLFWEMLSFEFLVLKYFLVSRKVAMVIVYERVARGCSDLQA